MLSKSKPFVLFSSQEWRIFGSIPMQACQQKDVFASYLSSNFQAVNRVQGCGLETSVAFSCAVFKALLANEPLSYLASARPAFCSPWSPVLCPP